MGLLARTRTYLAGNLEFSSDTTNWRKQIQWELGKLDIICLNPMEENFIGDIQEDDAYRNKMIKMREHGDYEFVRTFMKRIIQKDLRLIDIVDFIIFKFEFDCPTYGTLHELFVANFQKKPCFVIAEDKRKIPLWLVGLIPEKYIYRSVEHLIEMIYSIDNGSVKIDSDRWKILKPNLR